MRIDAIVEDWFDELDAFGPYEVFGHVRSAGADLDVAYTAVDRDLGEVVTASLGTATLVQRRVEGHADLADPAYALTVVRERVVDAGAVLTAGGVTSGIDLALHLVERLCGPEPADRAARSMEHRRLRAGEPSVIG